MENHCEKNGGNKQNKMKIRAVTVAEHPKATGHLSQQRTSRSWTLIITFIQFIQIYFQIQNMNTYRKRDNVQTICLVFFFWGGGQNERKMHTEMIYFCHFYAEIMKFGLILTHLSLFWGENWRGKNILGGLSNESTIVPKVIVWAKESQMNC